MNKKVYIAPAMEIAEMVSDVIMTGGSISMYSDGEGVNTAEDGVQLGNGRRGSWGNLWD